MNREGEREREGERGERKRQRDTETDRQTESRQMDILTDRERGTDGHREDTEKESRQANPSNVYLAHTHSLLKPEEFEENTALANALKSLGISRRSSTENLLMWRWLGGGRGGGGEMRGRNQDDGCEKYKYIFLFLIFY